MQLPGSFVACDVGTWWTSSTARRMLATVQHAQTPFEVSEGANKNVSTIRNEKENNEHIVQSYAQFSSFNADLDLFHAIALHCVCVCARFLPSVASFFDCVIFMIIVIICILLLLLVLHLLWLFTLNLLVVYFDNCSRCHTILCSGGGGWVCVMTVATRPERRKREFDIEQGVTERRLYSLNGHLCALWERKQYELHLQFVSACCWLEFFKGFRRLVATIENTPHRKSHSLHLITVRSHFMCSVSMPVCITFQGPSGFIIKSETFFTLDFSDQEIFYSN